MEIKCKKKVLTFLPTMLIMVIFIRIYFDQSNRCIFHFFQAILKTNTTLFCTISIWQRCFSPTLNLKKMKLIENYNFFLIDLNQSYIYLRSELIACVSLVSFCRKKNYLNWFPHTHTQFSNIIIVIKARQPAENNFQKIYRAGG